MEWVIPFLSFYFESLITVRSEFYRAREEYRKTAKAPHGYQPRALELGFNCLGLYAYSRHPNFAAEQAIWVGLYQWGCWTSDVMFNWTFLGAISYLMLFQASTWFTELVTAGKYPEYKEYQKEVGKFVPRLASIYGQIKEQNVVEAVDGAGPKKEVTAAKSKKKAGIERDQPKRSGSKRL
jgi:steroid 5-alpha reductase family enzyme